MKNRNPFMDLPVVNPTDSGMPGYDDTDDINETQKWQARGDKQGKKFRALVGASPKTSMNTKNPFMDLPMMSGDKKADPSFMQKLPANLLTGLAKFGHGALNAESNIAQYLESQFPNEHAAKDLFGITAKDIPRQKDYDYSGMTRELMGVPKTDTFADRLVQGAAQYAPAAIGAAAATPVGAGLALRGLTQGGAGGIFGATQAEKPEDVGQDTLTNALLGPVAELGIVPFKAAGKLLEPFRPAKMAENLLKHLGGGAKNVEENAQSLSKDIRSGYDKRMGEYKAVIDPVLEQHGKKSIYPYIDPVKELKEKGGRVKVGANLDPYYQMPKYALDTSNSDLKKVFKSFKQKPTFENAHKLQSEIGAEMGDLMNQKKRGIDVRDQIASLKKVRDSLKGGINDFLKTLSPADAKAYKEASNLYKEHVVPYRSDRTLEAIAKGKETNPKNVHNIFEYPTDTVLPSGKTSIGPIKKVMQDLGDKAKGKIMYSKIGGHSKYTSPERIAKAMTQAEEKGYSDYSTPTMQKMVDKIASRTTTRNVGSAAAGGILGSFAPIPGSSVLGAMAGYAIPSMASKVGDSALMKSIAKYMGKATRGAGRLSIPLHEANKKKADK